jgi:hypothetical protein
VATYVALESHYGRLDGSHTGSVVAFAILFGCAALAAGALADAFRSWNRTPAADAPASEEANAEPREAEPEPLDTLFERAIEAHGALSLLLVRPQVGERFDSDGDSPPELVEHIDRLVRRHLRRGDWLVRQDGLELSLVLPRTSLEAARTIAERIRLAVREEPLDAGDGSLLRCSLAIGIAACPTDARTAAALRAAAEHAATAAEQLGGNRTVLRSVPPGAPRGWGLARNVEA